MIKFRCPGCPVVYSVEVRRGWNKESCPSCGSEFIIPGDDKDTPQPSTPHRDDREPSGKTRTAPKIESKRLLAGVLAFLFGEFGVHKFILGYNRTGLIYLTLTLLTCGMWKIVTLIDGIVYLTKSDAEFIQTYQIGTKEWF